MMAPAPAAMTTSAAALPAISHTSSVAVATAPGAYRPRRMIGFNRRSAGYGRRGARRLRDETVAGAAHRLDHPIHAMSLECEPQSADVYVDRALLDVNVIAPHPVQ